VSPLFLNKIQCKYTTFSLYTIIRATFIFNYIFINDWKYKFALPLQARMKFIITLFAIGLLLRFLVRYIIPVFRITSMTGDRLRQMQDQMNNMERKANEHNAKATVKKEGDYIDYEEVR
jgi:hypothetical protein